MINFWIYLSLYILLLIFVWGFFLVAKIHIYKFKEYSSHVQPVTRFMGLFLLILTIIGFVVVGQEYSSPSKPTTVRETTAIEQY